MLRRDKIEDVGAQRGATVTRVEYIIREAIQPFLDRGFASRMEVRAERAAIDRIDAVVVLYRGPERAIALQYEVLWSELIEGAA